MGETPKDINEECKGHHLELLEISDFGKLYGCPLCGKSVFSSNSRFLLGSLIITSILSFILILIMAFYPELL
jgi:hypothetical protein|tara:strand:- start:5562 stop:5777 length:216 start_codon:yes stop_codon:yes gene_type:complete